MKNTYERSLELASLRTKAFEIHNQNPALNKSELARQLGLCESTLRHWIQRGEKAFLPRNFECSLCHKRFSSGFAYAGHQSRGACARRYLAKVKEPPISGLEQAVDIDGFLGGLIARLSKTKSLEAEVSRLTIENEELKTKAEKWLRQLVELQNICAAPT